MRYFIQIDINGNILFLGEYEPIVLSHTRSFTSELSEDAYWYLESSNIRNTSDTDMLRFYHPGILRLKTEKVVERDEDIIPDTIVDFRINYISRGWDRIAREFFTIGVDLAAMSYSEIRFVLTNLLKRSEESSSGDAAVMAWMNQTRPRHEIISLASDACTLISNARVEDMETDDLPLICLKAEDGYLYDNVIELLSFYDGSNLSILVARKVAPKLLINEIGTVDDERVEKEIQFIRKYLAVKNCEKSPVEVLENLTQKERKLAARGIKKTGGVFRYSVSLSKRYASIKRERHEAMDKDGKVLTTVKVSGFVRNQAYGEGRSLRKRIWVDGFTRGQWVRTGVTYVTIKE